MMRSPYSCSSSLRASTELVSSTMIPMIATRVMMPPRFLRPMTQQAALHAQHTAGHAGQPDSSISVPRLARHWARRGRRAAGIGPGAAAARPKRIDVDASGVLQSLNSCTTPEASTSADGQASRGPHAPAFLGPHPHDWRAEGRTATPPALGPTPSRPAAGNPRLTRPSCRECGGRGRRDQPAPRRPPARAAPACRRPSRRRPPWPPPPRAPRS